MPPFAEHLTSVHWSFAATWSFPYVFKIVALFKFWNFITFEKYLIPLTTRLPTSEYSTITSLIPTSLGNRRDGNNNFGLRHLLCCHLIENKQRDTTRVCYHSLVYSSYCYIVYNSGINSRFTFTDGFLEVCAAFALNFTHFSLKLLRGPFYVLIKCFLIRPCQEKCLNIIQK